MRKLTIASMLSGLILLVILSGGGACADEAVSEPILPHGFYGTVEVAGEPATDGIRVEARGEGVITGDDENPIFTVGGMYGKPGLNPKLLVQGSIAPGTPIEFYVGGVKAEVRDVKAGGEWQTNIIFTPGEVTELNLRISTQVTPEVTITKTLPTTSVSYYQVTTSATSAGSAGSVPGVSDPGSAPLTGSATPKTTSAQPASSPASHNPVSGQPEGGTSPGEAEPGTGEDSPAAAPVVTGGSIPSSWMLGLAVAILVLIGAGIYYSSRKKEDGKDEPAEKEEEK
jgi:hypothetical protein